MDNTVESLCNLLARHRLLDAAAVRSARQRWRSEARNDADDAAKFSKWLIANGLVTDFQLGMLTRGFADMLYLNEYKLLDRIGQGRMAGVYKAIHSSGQVVAVKVLPPSKAKHPQLLARFMREARLAVRLDHPNVVRTFQTGKTKGDLRFIVMEFLDGETLEDVLQRRKRLPAAEAAHVLAQTLRGLEHLDEKSLVHRDLKPANLMLVPALGATGLVLNSTVKILDIGLSRALFDEDSPNPEEIGEVTNEGTLLGTPSYMAPEQARSAHTADIRADIYSLGCVFFEMLTGQTPFPDTSFVRQMVRHATEPVRPANSLNPQLPDAVQPLLNGLLAKDPAQRFATPGQALKAALTLVPASAPLPAPQRPEGALRSFLTYLQTRPPDDEDEEMAATVICPADQMTPRSPPPAPADPGASGRAAAPARAAVATAPAPPVANRGAAPTPSVTPAVAARPAAVPTVAPVATVATPARPVVVSSSVAAAQPAIPGARLLCQVGPVSVYLRDLISAGLSVGVLLLLEGFLWVISLLFR